MVINLAKLKVKRDGIYIGDQCVMQIGKDHLHISLGWLKTTGFKGDVEISNSLFGDKKVFHAEI